MLKSIYITLLFSLILCLSVQAQPHTKLQNQIAQIAHSSSGKVGVYIRLLETGDTLSYHNRDRYVMQSVFKLAVAMAVLHEVDQNHFRLTQRIHLTKADLPENYSPLRDKYPDANVDVTLNDLLTYMVTLSDNDACDILLKLLGGPQKVESYVHGLGIKPIAIKYSEHGMGTDWTAQYQNWCWPSTQVGLLDKIFHQSALHKTTNALLWQLLLHTVVTPKRIKGLLPQGTQVWHRSGTSGVSDLGLAPATNDAGVILLPDGRHLAVAIFVTDSHDDSNKREQVIAQIAKAAYDEYAH